MPDLAADMATMEAAHTIAHTIDVDAAPTATTWSDDIDLLPTDPAKVWAVETANFAAGDKILLKVTVDNWMFWSVASQPAMVSDETLETAFGFESSDLLHNPQPVDFIE